MPTYTFEIIETGEQYDEMMKISERDDYIKNNPQVKPVISMVHRIQNRSSGYTKTVENTMPIQQPSLSTEGATALDMNIETETALDRNLEADKNEIVLKDNKTENLSAENISLENATYLQNIESQDDTPNFEVDSIELSTPDLFTQEEKIVFPENQNLEDKTPEIFDNLDNSESLEETQLQENYELEEKDAPEMFEKSEFEEDFEIPAFLRRQKN